MIFKWTVQETDNKNIREFLKQKDFSASQISNIKNHDGHIYVDKKERYLNYKMQTGAQILVQLPIEIGSKKIEAVNGELDICYEDEFYLVVNKPAGLASLPARKKTSATMANYIKAYLQSSNAPSDSVHVVTRLDRDTSGLMIFAKSSWAHSLISDQLHDEKFIKQYVAVAEKPFEDLEKSEINLPIGVSTDFYMKRVIDENGKDSLTKYEVLNNFSTGALVKVDLMTGRTHQIRVHFSAIGHPLFGDSLYADDPTDLINRQALHCFRLSFIHPFTKKTINIESKVPKDIENLIQKLRD